MSHFDNRKAIGAAIIDAVALIAFILIAHFNNIDGTYLWLALIFIASLGAFSGSYKGANKRFPLETLLVNVIFAFIGWLVLGRI